MRLELATLMLFSACTGSDSDDDSATVENVVDGHEWDQTTAPSDLVGELRVTRTGTDATLTEHGYVLLMTGPGFCTLEGCEWAVKVGGSYTLATSTVGDTGTPDPSIIDYDATLQYIPDTYPVGEVIAFTTILGGTQLDETLAHVYWETNVGGLLVNLASGTTEGCFDSANAEDCQITGTLTVTP